MRNIANNANLLSYEEAIELGYISVNSGGRTRNISIAYQGMEYIVNNGPYASYVTATPSGFSVNLATFTIPVSATKWCIIPDYTTTTASTPEFIQWTSEHQGFGGAYIQSLVYHLIWKDGNDVVHDDYVTSLEDDSTVTNGSRIFVSGSGETSYSINHWGYVGYADSCAPYTIEGVETNTYSGYLTTALTISVTGAKFFCTKNEALEYINSDEDEYTGPVSEQEGYDGYSGTGSSDTIVKPPFPRSIMDLGFLNVYKCEAGSLRDFGEALFPTISFPSSLAEVGEVLAAISDSIWNSKLIDYVVSVHMIPTDVQGGALTDIKVGARTMTGIMGRPISNEYIDYDFGQISIPHIYGNFADYMTSVQLWLPFYGFINLKAEEIIGGTIAVEYRFNVIDGSFMAYVFSTSDRSDMTRSLIGQYGGSAVIHLPISSNSYASLFSGLVGGAGVAKLGKGIATGNLGMAGVGGMLTGSALMSALQGGDVNKCNAYNSSSAFMTKRKPYLIIEAPVSSFSEYYLTEKGVPSNVRYTLSQCKGFTIATSPILDGIPCTLSEKEKIKDMLAEGVVFK